MPRQRHANAKPTTEQLTRSLLTKLNKYTFKFIFLEPCWGFSAVQSEVQNFFAQISNPRIGGIPIKNLANNDFFKSLTVLQVHLQLHWDV